MSDRNPVGRDDPGVMIRHWRIARGLSQMALALDVGVSARHMSFVETGRSRPSRDLVIRLAQALQIPSREENALLERSGYARRHAETDLGAPEMTQVRKTLRFLLDRHEPNSALVFDRHWNIVMSNRAHRSTLAFLTDGRSLPEDIEQNLIRLTFHPEGLRPFIANWGVVGPALLMRLSRESAAAPSDEGLADLIEEVARYAPMPAARSPELGNAPLLPIHFRKDGVELRLFSVLSTIGSAIDVGLQELMIETFFPADATSEAFVAQLWEGA
ncbi:MAG: helix-turn-helix transcriptional regulator [Gemmatimonadota bacterium]